MPMFVSNRDETVRLFSNPVLEYFTHIHPATPIVVFIPVSLYCAFHHLQVASVAVTTSYALLGVLMWTLFEYTLHRWAFHYDPKSSWGKKMHFWVHGIHHDYPRDHTRLVMPLLVSVPLAALIFALLHSMFGVLSFALFSGFIFGYVCYDSIHYATHHFPMRSGIAKWMKEYHLRHHYNDEHSAYGVSNPLWDYVFRTTPEYLNNAEQTHD